MQKMNMKMEIPEFFKEVRKVENEDGNFAGIFPILFGSQEVQKMNTKMEIRKRKMDMIQKETF